MAKQSTKKSNSAPISKSKAIKKTPSKASSSPSTASSKKSTPALKNAYMKQIPMFKNVSDYFQKNNKYASK
jgi:hypothetical protein